MEGGAAIAALLTGKANPCGKLPDTFARDLSDYPSTEHFHDSPHYVDYTEDIYVGYRYFETIPGAAERVCYPFGYGLSYTSFALETVSAGGSNGRVEVSVRVTNTGKRAGREVVQLYYQAPWGLLQKPKRCLAAFQKTKLLEPGESQTVELTFAVSDMASFDDLGKIAPSAWVLEKGRYPLYMGTSVRDTVELDWAWEQPETVVLAQLSASLAPSRLEKRLRKDAFAPVPDEEAFVPESDEAEEPSYQLVRSKRFFFNAMSVEEAILQMNLVDHTFFAFRNEDEDGAFSVVYKRNGGGYGIIVDQA